MNQQLSRRPVVDTIEGHSFVGSWLEPGSLVIDLGVNRGNFSRALRDRYRCIVRGVEPVPALHDKLGDLDVTAAAVTALAGTIELRLDSHGDASVVLENDGEVISVPAVTLEQVVGDASPELVKVDIEGAELEVLLTAPDEVLRSIGQLSVEFHDFLDPSLGADVQRVDGRLRSLGFVPLRFSRDNSNVLYVNMARTPLGLLRRWSLLARHRYAAGLGRVIRRRFGW